MHTTTTTPQKTHAMTPNMYTTTTTTTFKNPTPRTIIGHSPHPPTCVGRMGICLVLCLCLCFHSFITQMIANIIHVGVFLHLFSS